MSESDVDEILELLGAEIEDQWMELEREDYVPAMCNGRDRVKDVADRETNSWESREWGIYNAGVLRGIQIAHKAVLEAHREGEEEH